MQMENKTEQKYDNWTSRKVVQIVDFRKVHNSWCHMNPWHLWFNIKNLIARVEDGRIAGFRRKKK